MSCEYAASAGFREAIHKMHHEIDKRCRKAIDDAKELHAHDPKYWRVIGRQDELLELMDVICDMIRDK